MVSGVVSVAVVSGSLGSVELERLPSALLLRTTSLLGEFPPTVWMETISELVSAVRVIMYTIGMYIGMRLHVCGEGYSMYVCNDLKVYNFVAYNYRGGREEGRGTEREGERERERELLSDLNLSYFVYDMCKTMDIAYSVAIH